MRIRKQYSLGPNPLQTKVLPIGVWNMDGTGTVNVAHGLTLADIREVTVSIIKDDASTQLPLNFASAGGTLSGDFYRSATNVVLARTVGRDFDNINYNDAVMNRGWVVIKYV